MTTTEGTNNSSYDDVFTRDTNGKLAVRVVGAGGGDSHNLGYFATPQALSEAYPTGEEGDYAIIGSTDTVWIWDSGTSAWVDTDTKGQVESVNGQTGTVVLTASDVGAQPTLVSGTNIKSVNNNSLLGSGDLELSTYLTYPAGWTTNSTTKAFCDSIAADTTATVGKAYLGEVTCSDLPAGMLNAEIVVEIMDGTTVQDKVIVLSLKSGNVAPYAWQYVYWDNGTNVSGWKTWQEPLVSGTNIKTVNNTSLLGSGNITIDSLPTQAGNSGKFLTTDGTDASWSDKPLVNTTSRTGALAILGGANGDYSTVVGDSAGSYGTGGVAVGASSSVGNSAVSAVAVGREATASKRLATAIGGSAKATAEAAIQLGEGTNSTDATFNVGFYYKNVHYNYQVLNTDGTIPKERLANFVTTPSTAPVLAVADWSSNTQTITVTGVTATNTVFVAPAPASAADYAAAGILCTAQAADSLTFTCTTVPSNAITLSVVILG
ncbi:MAG: hypothetical protein J6W29_03310 [Neisseriaceae bacterium]|nr:hypothetical protein [Neisseriaceae bacterium]